MRQQVFIRSFILGFFIFSGMGANTGVLCQQDTITVELILFPNIDENVQVFFLSDFDLMELGTGPELFRIIIYNRGPAKYVVGRFSIVSDNFGTLLSGQTKPFLLDSNWTVITNHELFSTSGDFALDNYSLEDAAAELRNLLLQTNKLPTDTYSFTWKILDTQNQLLDDDTQPLTITNPTSLDLIAPGTEATSAELPIIFTAFPLFQWESDASDFILTVCERMDPGQSPEEVMNGEPRLRKEIEDENFCQYPASEPGVWPLEEGKTYYWQVAAKIVSPGGPVELPGEIWGFTIADQGAVISNIEQMRTISNLRTILGDEIVEKLFGMSGELDGFTITGVVLLDGKRISLDDLTELIEKILSGEIKVKSFIVE